MLDGESHVCEGPKEGNPGVYLGEQRVVESGKEVQGELGVCRPGSLTEGEGGHLRYGFLSWRAPRLEILVGIWRLCHLSLGDCGMDGAESWGLDIVQETFAII